MRQNFVFIFPVFRGPYGGERHCIRLAGELAQRGFGVSIWTHSFAASCRSLLHQSVAVHAMPWGMPQKHNWAVLAALFRMPRLAELLRAQDIKNTIIVAMGWQAAYALRSLKNTQARRVYYCLEPPRFLYDLQSKNGFLAKLATMIIGPYIRRLDTTGVNSAEQLLSNGKATQKEMQRIYRRESTVVYPGIEIERFTKYTRDEARRALKLKPTDRIFASVGKLHRRKRIDAVIAYFDKQPSGELYIIGDGPERTKLEGLAKDQHEAADRIHFLGQQTDDQVALYMRAADYFIFTAINEPFGLVVAEAKAAGCKIVPVDISLPTLTWQESAQEFLQALHVTT